MTTPKKQDRRTFKRARKPAPKRKAWKRWSVDSHGYLCLDGAWLTLRQVQALADALNAERVTLPRGRR